MQDTFVKTFICFPKDFEDQYHKWMSDSRKMSNRNRVVSSPTATVLPTGEVMVIVVYIVD